MGRGRERVLTEEGLGVGGGERITGIRGVGRGKERVLTEKDMRGEERRTGIRGLGREKEACTD